jgi:LacI family transcriptional regulator
MRSARLRVLPGYVVESTFEERCGFEAMEQLLALERRPTAVVVWSLAAAVGALAAANANDLAIPEQLSMIGFHDAPFAAYLTPPLTTVWMPLYEMAESSIGLLVRLIGGESVKSVTVTTPPRLIERASAGPVPAEP